MSPPPTAGLCGRLRRRTHPISSAARKGLGGVTAPGQFHARSRVGPSRQDRDRYCELRCRWSSGSWVVLNQAAPLVLNQVDIFSFCRQHARSADPGRVHSVHKDRGDTGGRHQAGRRLGRQPPTGRVPCYRGRSAAFPQSMRQRMLARLQTPTPHRLCRRTRPRADGANTSTEKHARVRTTASTQTGQEVAPGASFREPNPEAGDSGQQSLKPLTHAAVLRELRAVTHGVPLGSHQPSCRVHAEGSPCGPHLVPKSGGKRLPFAAESYKMVTNS